MKLLITGSDGFIGKNLVAQLKSRGYTDLFLYDRNQKDASLEKYLEECDFLFHLAGINRSDNPDDFEQGNTALTNQIIKKLKSCSNTCPILASSSIQAELDTPYGKSKRAMEDVLFAYASSCNVNVYVYRLPNVYGKWCKPNYNSVVATFCHNVSRNLDLRIDNPDTVLQLVYIDDVVDAFIRTLEGKPIVADDGFCQAPIPHPIKLGQLAEKLILFHKNRQSLEMPAFAHDFDRKLYATYSSYLPQKLFSYKLDPKTDERGYFCECLKCSAFGQVSISVTKPGIVRGNHWHHTKVEKFLVVKGSAVIRFRLLNSEEILDYYVDGSVPEIIDVPVGYTHSIQNIGDSEMIALIWSSEEFNPQYPDTYFDPVITE